MPSLIGLLFFSIMQIIFLPLLKLQNVFYNEEITLVQNYKKMKVFKNYKINRIKRYFFYFYKIEILDEEIKSVLLFPHISGVFFKFGFKPDSIKRYEETIKQKKIDSTN